MIPRRGNNVEYKRKRVEWRRQPANSVSMEIRVSLNDLKGSGDDNTLTQQAEIPQTRRTDLILISSSHQLRLTPFYKGIRVECIDGYITKACVDPYADNRRYGNTHRVLIKPSIETGLKNPNL